VVSGQQRQKTTDNAKRLHRAVKGMPAGRVLHDEIYQFD